MATSSSSRPRSSSKAEGRLVAAPGTPAEREAARQASIDGESVREVARRGTLRITQTHHGLVMANAGVDASNVADGTIALLPLDSDESARRIRDRLRALCGVTVAVVVSDTFGRPWRHGLTDVAIGCAGIAAVRDYRGRRDAHGHELAMTEVADVDEIAAAAELVMGKTAGPPGRRRPRPLVRRRRGGRRRAPTDPAGRGRPVRAGHRGGARGRRRRRPTRPAPPSPATPRRCWRRAVPSGPSARPGRPGIDPPRRGPRR
jgi:coenzyme F420-0:L-glutamate ligase/coenzyme F420-1:gamma-L-glutamate ligase